MRDNSQAIQFQHERYMEIDKKLNELLDELTEREILMMSISWFARLAGVSRTTIHQPREVYQRIQQKKSELLQK